MEEQSGSREGPRRRGDAYILPEHANSYPLLPTMLHLAASLSAVDSSVD